MLKDITLGQYFPGDSIVHRLDPRTKLILVVVYIVALFLARFVFSYGIMMSVLITCYPALRGGVQGDLQGHEAGFPDYSDHRHTQPASITAPAPCWCSSGASVFTPEGVRMAVMMVLRIMMLISGTFLLTYTTSPILLTDGIENLLGPLKKIQSAHP